MISTFWLNNFHFALEFFGAAVLFILSWLAFDAFLIKKEFKTLARSLGFLFFAFWEIINSLSPDAGIYWVVASILYLAGLFFILLNLWLEKPPQRPVFEAVIFLPAISTVLLGNHIIATVILTFITILAIKKIREGEEKLLKSFTVAFGFLTLSSLLAIFNAKIGQQNSLWIKFRQKRNFARLRMRFG